MRKPVPFGRKPVLPHVVALCGTGLPKYLKNIQEPSGLATALNIGAAGLSYGMAYNKGLTALNSPSNMASATSGAATYGSGTGGFEGFKPAGQFEIPTRTLGGK